MSYPLPASGEPSVRTRTLPSGEKASFYATTEPPNGGWLSARKICTHFSPFARIFESISSIPASANRTGVGSAHKSRNNQPDVQSTGTEFLASSLFFCWLVGGHRLRTAGYKWSIFPSLSHSLNCARCDDGRWRRPRRDDGRGTTLSSDSKAKRRYFPRDDFSRPTRTSTHDLLSQWH